MYRINLTQTATIENPVEQFIAEVDVKESSKSTYRRQIRQFIEWCEKAEIINPTRETVLQYRQYLLDTGHAAITVSAYIMAIQHLYAWMAEKGISEDIAAGVKLVRQPSGFRKDALSLEQARSLLECFNRNTIQGLRDYAIVNLMLRTGLREIEVTRADIGDIRSMAGTTVMMIQGKGMDRKEEIAILTDDTLKPIQEYLRVRGASKHSEPLFASISDRNDGDRLSTRSVSRIAKESLRKIGIDSQKVTAHSLRHSAITFCLLAGGSIQEAQMLARHRNIQTTMIYAHNVDRIRNAPERRIDDLLGRIA